MDAPFQIGEWLIEPQLNRVSGPSGSLAIEPRTMKVLVQLVQKKPDVVTREELMDVVWKGSIVTEHSLTIAISDLRKLFKDDPKAPAVIETIRGVGYRFIAKAIPDLCSEGHRCPFLTRAMAWRYRWNGQGPPGQAGLVGGRIHSGMYGRYHRGAIGQVGKGGPRYS